MGLLVPPDSITLSSTTARWFDLERSGAEVEQVNE
jgi:hypothetical protein